MAVVPIIVGWGNSNWDGIAPLAGVPAPDMARWTGSNLPTASMPYIAQAPGVRVFSLRFPYAIATTRNGDGTGAATATLDSSVPGTNDQWVYVSGPVGGTGQGQHRRISAGAGTANITVSPNWTVVPQARSVFQVLGSSHTAAAAGTDVLVNKSATTTAWTSAVVGRWMIGISGANAGIAKKITGFNSGTQVATEKWPSAFVSGDGLRILDGANSVETMAGISASNSEFRDFQFYYDFATSYSTGFEYPSIKSAPFACPLVHKNNQFTNALPELVWQMRSQFQEKIHVVSVGAAASTISPLYAGDSMAAAQFSWAHDLTHLDFHPASPNGLYQVLTQCITAACAIVTAEGNTPNVVGFFGIPSENDASNPEWAAAFKSNLALIRDSLRKFVADNGCSKLKPHEIPFIVSNLNAATNTYAVVTNQAMADLAAQDSRTGVVETSDATYVATVHFDAPFYIKLGKRFFDAWKTIFDKDDYARRTLADLPTLSKLRSQVRRRFERSTQSNDHPDPQIDQFLNDSLREINNTLGDSAWYLRRAEAATLEPGIYPATISLEGHIARPLRIESASNPGRSLVWKGISHTTSLRTQITLHECTGGGPFIVHFIQLPKELVNGSDIAILPGQYMELLVALTCKRLSECVGNSALAMYYDAECGRLWRYVRRDCLRYDRMRQDQLQTTDAYSSLSNGTTPSYLWYL